MKLDRADRAIEAVLAEASVRGSRPLGVIVLDAGGHPVSFRRQDGASLFRFKIARAKAMGALGFGTDTRELAERAAANPIFFTSVAVATGGDLALSPGGVLVRGADGAIVGAIGVSGDTPDIDEACARSGAASIQGDDRCRI